ncbi:bacteriocin-like protein [Chryseobacterium sp. MIQD13]|uniref:bacteriocin-like protein n=1 Tax=Chryseobacterium sp. MIQD13 TaxID=3422310 RepID=UPI003D2CACA0
MKNLKKLNREQQRQINGGVYYGQCGPTRPCSVGWCCNGTCSPFKCLEPDQL